ncbi:metalloregulator ArsR/SmtB family transcription factor [Halopseudomonas aestusnigri]|uniref:metalloregulator ArsR/SmtB family transcription factor n=1 Tax=Halopseudomonas TaxID=2901189 RepID=UPI001E4A4355|nr:metalloregulator ArsR/SmtB family transcription factor [Halopseudomonas aestusnigri]UGV32765.1 metalloregulator ArsR/SmtB family transcription factor [Halopseudomonas aestusnigri]
MNDPLTPPALFKALADDTRARICALLVDGPELCVCELTGALALSQPKISRHLASLRKLNVLMDERRGQWVYYRLHPDLPAWAAEVIRQAAHSQPCWLETERARLAGAAATCCEPSARC